LRSSVRSPSTVWGELTLDNTKKAGGGSGIGLGIATRLGLHGTKVVIMGRRKDFLERAAVALRQQGITIATFAGDVRSEDDARKAVGLAVREFGKLDTLVNCAAGNFLSLAENLTTKGFTTVMEIDAIGTFNMCRQSLDALRDSKQGVIINISATLHYSTTWYQTHACAAKAAIDSMTRQLALEWGAFNIRVNGVAPGPIDGTPGFVKLTGADKNFQGQMQQHMVPLGRLGTVTDVVRSSSSVAVR